MVKRFIVDDMEWGNTYLKRAIDKGTIEQNNERQKVRSSMYASDYGQCMRKVFMSFYPDLFGAEDIPPRVLRIFHHGNDTHERLGGYLRRDKLLDFRDEVDVPRDDLDVHGRCDGICSIDGRAVVVEFKSINKDIVDKPKEEHIGQLMFYLSMFKKLRKDLKEDFGFGEFDVVMEKDLSGVEALSGRVFEDLSHVDKWLLFTSGEMQGELIYESKSRNDTFHFPIEYDEDKAKKVRLWFEQLKWYIDNNMIPPVHYNGGFYPCQWKGKNGTLGGKCAFYNVCWGDSGLKNEGMRMEEGLLRIGKK
jgi:hypothetical protein